MAESNHSPHEPQPRFRSRARGHASRWWPRFSVLLLIAMGGLAAAGSTFGANPPPASAGVRSPVQEPEIKAAGLFKIISFVEWPATAFPSPDAPLIVGVMGAGPISDLLELFMENETWHGRKVMVRRLPSARAVEGCHVLFVGRTEHANWLSIRDQFARKPILTMSDASRFARNGGIVELAIERNRLHLIVNLEATRMTGVTISSKLLRLAEIVGEAGP